MSLLKGKGSFSVYRPKKESLVDVSLIAINERIQSNTFKDIDDTFDTESVGWVSVYDMFDSSLFPEEKHMFGDYVVMSVRLDERKVPSSVIKKYIEKEERRIKIEKGIPRISRTYRAEIKERIISELFRKAKPVPSVFDMAWNIGDNTILFFSCSTRAKEIFEALFKKTFGFDIVQWQPLVTESEDFSNVIPWIWWREESGRPAKAMDEENSSVIVGNNMRLSGQNESVTCNCVSDEMVEARAALRAGKSIDRAALRIDVNDFSWSFIFSSVEFEFKGVSIPLVGGKEEETDTIGIIMQIVSLYLQLVEAMETICSEFLRCQKEDESDVRSWVLSTGEQP